MVQPRATAPFNVPKRRQVDGGIFGCGQFGQPPFQPQSRARRKRPATQRPCGGHIAIGRPRHDHPVGQGATWNERGQIRVPRRATALMAGHMDVRVPTARHAKRANIEGADRPIGKLYIRKGQTKSPLGINDLPVQNLKIHTSGRIGAHIHNGRNLNTLCVQIGGGAVAVVIVGENRHALVGRDAVAVRIGADRRPQHNAGAVVVFKCNGAFNRPRCQHCALGINAPQNLARFAGIGYGHVVADPFHRAVNSVIKRADHSRAHHQAHVWQACQFSDSARSPNRARIIANAKRLGIQPPTKGEIFICEDDIGT